MELCHFNLYPEAVDGSLSSYCPLILRAASSIECASMITPREHEQNCFHIEKHLLHKVL
jgi:hypothetical protein